MPTFKSKPVYIEARQVTEENKNELLAWCGGSLNKDGDIVIGQYEYSSPPKIARESDWIVEYAPNLFKVLGNYTIETKYEEVSDT